MLLGRRALVIGATTAMSKLTSGCGKKRGPPPPVVWLDDVERAFSEAKRKSRALLLLFGADWDTASKELEYRTFPDPDVGWLLVERFVCARVDCTDDEDRKTQDLTRRFAVRGTPTLLAIHPSSGNELWRACEYTPPEKLAAELRGALARASAMHDVTMALRLGVSWKRPVVLFFGPTWDHDSQEMRRACFTDWQVSALLRDSFVFSDVRRDDGWNEEWARFRVRTLPTTLVLNGAGRIELSRCTQVLDPRVFEDYLGVALARYRA